jgi:ABC-2 type transport system permease protein
MKLDRVWTVTLKTLRSLKHDRRTLAIVVLVPLLMIVLFGYTFGGDIKDVKVNIVNLDEGVLGQSLGAQISDQLMGSSVLRVESYHGPGETNASKIADAVSAVRDCRAWGAIVFEEGFSASVMQAIHNMTHGLTVEQAPIKVYLDASNPNMAQAVAREVQAALQRVLVEDYNMAPPITMEQEMVYGEGAEFIDFFAPGVMGLAATMVTFMLSIISFIHERTSFTLDRMLTSPVSEGEIVTGYVLAFGILGMVQSVIILTTAILLFQIQIVGSTLLVLLILFLLGLGMQGLGFLLSSRAKSEFQAIQLVPLILIPSILLAGVFWPLESVPEVLRPISWFIPLTYAVEACRSVMIRGWGVEQVWPSLTILALFAVAMLLLSAWSLRRRG